jgi:hypothetical protein
VMDMINGRGAPSGRETTPALQGSGTESLFEQAPQAGPYGSQDTLIPDDREGTWGGPGT